MKWDPELAAAPSTECPPELQELVEEDDDIKSVDGETSAVSLKRELQRMLTTH